MQAVQAAHVLAVGAGFAAEAGGVGGHFYGEILFVEDHVAVDVRDGNFGRGDQVEVIDRGVVHLPLLVGELSRTEARSLVDHDRRLDFEIAGFGVAVEEVVDQRPLQACALALVDGESGTREFYAQIEVDDVVFAGQLPVGQRVFGQFGVAFDEFYDEVVLCGFALRDDLGGEVGQRDDRGLQLLLHFARFGLQAVRFLLEVGDEAFALLGLFAAALPHQRTDLLGGFVLRGQRIVQFYLNGLAAVVQRFDLFDDGCGVHTLFGQFADRGLFVIADLL